MTERYAPGPAKLLVLALDAASPVLLRRWAADGTLPNLAALLRDGLSADTRTVEALYVGATWPSFYTGLNPAGHGIYWLERLVPGTYRLQRVRPADLARRKPLWEILSDAGRRVAVLDVPLAPVSSSLHGFQVSSWGDHDRAFAFQTCPKELASEVLRRAGPHPAPAACDAPSRTVAEYRTFAEQLKAGAAARSRLTRELLAAHPWDFAIQVFSETHCAGHQLWHFHDPAHPAFDAAITAAEGDLVREVYVAVDRAVGEVLAAVPPETRVVVMSLHGMSHNCGASALLSEILVRLGVLRRLSAAGSEVPGAAPAEPPRPAAGGPRALLKAAWRLVPEAIRRPFWEWRQRVNQASGWGTVMDVDPAGSKCFVVWTGPLFAGIRLNLQGREPAGTLAPGAEADRFIAELTRNLQKLVHDGSGHPVVRQVHRTADLFRGACQDELPDLLVEWHTDPPLGTTAIGEGKNARIAVRSPGTGTVEMLNFNCRTGEHRIEGMFVARGPGIAPGRLERVIPDLDLAPTFARYLGVDMPGVDGAPIPELAGRP